MKTAIVFAGQGAQSTGMGAALCEAHPAARRVFDQATEIYRRITGSKKSMDEICALPLEELSKTANAQPALFTLSIAGLAVLREEYPTLEISHAAGFSMGECSALCGAGVLDFADAMELIFLRGEAMSRACAAADGCMYAILGVETSVCEAICAELCGDGILLPVNYNCPGQTVIAGERLLVEAAAAKLKENGAMKVVPLATEGAFHTPMMSVCRADFEAEISKFTFRAPKITFWSDVYGAPIEKITPAYLGEQMTSPVRWQSIVEGMLGDGVELFVELGAGKVLSGLIRRISRQAKVCGVEGVSAALGL